MYGPAAKEGTVRGKGHYDTSQLCDTLARVNQK